MGRPFRARLYLCPNFGAGSIDSFPRQTSSSAEVLSH